MTDYSATNYNMMDCNGNRFIKGNTTDCDMTDYEQWKQWLNKWNVQYEIWDCTGTKELVIPNGRYYVSINFELSGKFIDIDAFE